MHLVLPSGLGRRALAMWGLSAGCVLITGDDLRAHDRRLGSEEPPPGHTGETDSPAHSADTGTFDGDPDGSFARATPLTPDTWAAGVPVRLAQAHLDPSDDHDFFALPLDAGEIVQLWVEAWEAGDPEPCDALLQLHTAEGPFAHADDVIYGLRHTDPALFHQATTDGPLVLEVVQAEAWAGTPGRAGPECDYELWAMPRDLTEAPNNDTRPAVLGENLDGIFVPSTFSSTMLEAVGELSSDADIDLFPVTVPAGGTLMVSMWPQAQRGLEGVSLSLLHEDGTVLAANDAPEWVDFAAFDAVTEATLILNSYFESQLFVQVAAATTADPRMYAFTVESRPSPWSTFEVDPSNTPPFDNHPTPLTWSAPSGGTSLARTFGTVFFIDPDLFSIDAADVGGTLGGRVLDAAVQAGTAGSFAELKLELHDDVGNRLASSTTDLLGRDPALIAWPIPARLDRVVLTVSTLTGTPGNYLLTTSVSSPP